MAKNDMLQLLTALSKNLSAEDLMLSSLQALTAAEISMRRQELGMSQAQLAEKMGVKQAQISKWESGDVNFTLKKLVQIAFALDIKIQPPFKPREPIRVREISHISSPKWLGARIDNHTSSSQYRISHL